MALKRSFNAEGPCNLQRHYMVDAMRGLDKELLSLIEDNKYFVIHAARQSGKTTLLQALAARINAAGDYYALYSSLETIEGIADESVGIPAIINMLKNALINYRRSTAGRWQ